MFVGRLPCNINTVFIGNLETFDLRNKMEWMFILLPSVYLLLSVDGVAYYPCSRQELKQYVGVIGPINGVLHFSCKHPAKFILNGEAFELTAKAGPFLVQRRTGNKFRCVKEMVVDPKGHTVIVYFLPWIKRYYNPTVCEACAASGHWTMQTFVAKTDGYKSYNKVRVEIPPLGCNVPVGCPIRNPYKDIPCTACEPQEDDGLCCRACQQRYTYN